MATYNGRVTGGGLNLRATASTSATLLVQIPDTTQIVVSDYSGNSSWYCTTYSGHSGFVMAQYVSILSTVNPIPGTVTGGGLNLRQYPSTSAPALIQIPDRLGINVASHNSEWYSTSYGGYSGFVMRAYVTTSGGGSYPIIATVDTDLHGSGGYLNLRQSPNSGSTFVAQIPDDATINVSTLSGEWLPAKYQTYTGYVMAIYVMGSDEYNNTGGGATGDYTALICQGDTPSASDCHIAHTKLTAQYGAGAVDIEGFTLSSTTPRNPCADASDFAKAKNYDVLYWSGHGSSVPELNVGGGPTFNSYNTANSNWKNVSNRLKVPIFSACSQLDGETNRSRWAQIMRGSDIRAICGYHEVSPSNPYDDRIATAFFDYCKAGSTGNSVMYSWKNANTPNSGNNYMILVYYDDNRCYYRLPGFSSTTYPDPNRSSTSIYAYASFCSDGAIVPNALQQPMPAASEFPYELAITSSKVKSAAIADEPAVRCKVINDPVTGASFTGYGDVCMNAVDARDACNKNLSFAAKAYGSRLQAEAIVRNYDDVMMEVFDDGTEGEKIVIGCTTQFYNHYNGILLDRNCIVVSSDANGINAVTNQWLDAAPIAGTAIVQRQQMLDASKLDTFASTLGISTHGKDIKNVGYIYVMRDGRYVLQHDVQLKNGNRMLVDCMTNKIFK